MKTELWDEIERYIRHELNSEELQQFKKKLAEDPAFALKVKEHTNMHNELSFYAGRKNLRDTLNEFHKEITSESQISIPTRSVKPSIISYISIAASIGLISILLGFLGGRYLYKNEEASYQELKKDVDKIKNNQYSLKKEVETMSSTIPKITSGGTAFPISNSGLFLTSYHVVKGSKTVIIENRKFGTYQGTIVKFDQINDLALIQIEDSLNFSKAAKLPYTIKGKPCRLAEKVFALGYPKENLVYTEGTISCNTGYNEDTTSIQVSVPVNPGNSGSPVFDNQGNLVAMVKGTSKNASLTSYAIKASYLLEFINSYKPVPKARSNVAGLSREAQVDKLSQYTFMVSGYK